MDPDQLTPQNNNLDTEDGGSLSDDEYYKIVRPVRTYERDLAEYVRNTQASKTEVNLKEQEKNRDNKKVEKKEPVKYPKIEKTGKSSARSLSVLIIVLLFIAVGASAFFWFRNSLNKPDKQPESATIQFETIIKGDAQKIVAVEERSRETLARTLENTASLEEINTGEIIVFKLVDKISDQVIPMTPSTFLRRIESRAPAFFTRALGENMDFGLISFSKLSSFVIFEVEDFDNAFAGSLQWEKNMAIDLFGWISNETASGRSFEDMTISGEDLRVLKNQNGQIVLLYVFLNDRTLLITDKISTFKEILNVWR